MHTNLTLITVDVRGLAPPEPMSVILKQLSTLTSQQCLLVKHTRQPFPLYEKLADAGFSYHCVVQAQDAIELYIFHQSAQILFEQFLSDQLLPSNSLNKGVR